MTDGAGHIALFAFNATSPSKGAALFVEVTSARGSNTEEFAKSLATRVGAQAAPAPMQIAGQPAFRIQAPYRLKTYTQRNTYLVVHEDRVYMFSELTSPGATAAAPLETLLKTIKFTSPTAPIDHLDTFFDQPFAVFGKFSMNGPRSLRRYDNTPTELNLGVHDFRPESNGLEPIHIDIQPVTLPNPVSFSTIRDAYSASLVQQTGAPAPLTWEIHPTIPGLHISQPLLGTTKLPDGKSISLLNRFCILEFKPGEFFQILFCVAPGKPEEDKAWTDVSRKMLDTIKIIR